MPPVTDHARFSEPTNAPHHFHFGPFLIHSQLDIPELAQATGPATIPVAVTLGGAPDNIIGAAHYGALCQVAPAEYLLDIPGVARYYVAHGREVRVNLAPNAPLPDVSSFLLGSVFGALCHQNGLLPLHASAVELDGRVTAFLGESGAGKSTLAACLQSRGLNIISDDICLLEPSGDLMRVIPVAGWLKLWRNSLDHLGKPALERNRVFAADDKYRLYLSPHDSRPDAALANLIFLTRAASAAEEPALARLSTPETIALMMRLTYLGYITELTGSHARVFAQCARVLNRAHGYRLTVPWDLTKMDSVIDLLQSALLFTAN